MNQSVAIITGSSRGIGAETAKLFARHGYFVIINYLRDKESATAVVDEIIRSDGHSIAVQADISKESEVVKLFETVDKKPGQLTVLVNNAGILQRQCKLLDLTEERINEVFKVNVTGTILCCREAVKRMALSNGGSGGAIINVSSMAAKYGSPNEYIDYAASKGAVDTLTKGLAMEVAADGIRVNAVRPGLIYTDMHATGGEPERVDKLKPKIPMQRGGTAQEVAEAIFWLASEKASFSTGCLLDLAGGM